MLTILNMFLVSTSLLYQESAARTFTHGGTAVEKSFNRTVFIASVHHNDANLLDETWNDALVDLVEHIARDHVYVSLIDLAPDDGTVQELLALKDQLDQCGVGNSFDLQP